MKRAFIFGKRCVSFLIFCIAVVLYFAGRILLVVGGIPTALGFVLMGDIYTARDTMQEIINPWINPLDIM